MFVSSSMAVEIAFYTPISLLIQEMDQFGSEVLFGTLSIAATHQGPCPEVDVGIKGGFGRIADLPRGGFPRDISEDSNIQGMHDRWLPVRFLTANLSISVTLSQAKSLPTAGRSGTRSKSRCVQDMVKNYRLQGSLNSCEAPRIN